MIARASAVLLAASFVLLGFAACKDDEDDRPAPGGEYGNGGGGGGAVGVGTVSEGGLEGGEAGEAGDAGDLCGSGVVQQGAEIPSLPVSGTPPPALGGAITDGTYVLNEYNTYGADASTDDGGPATSSEYARATLVITSGRLRWLAARGPTNALPADTLTGATYTVVGTSMQTTSVCPTAGTMKALPYSAVGSSIAIFVDATHREVYERR